MNQFYFIAANSKPASVLPRIGRMSERRQLGAIFAKKQFMKKKKHPHDYREKLQQAARNPVKAAPYVKVKQVADQPGKPEFFNVKQYGADIVAFSGERPKGNPPEWVADFEKYNHLR